MRERRFSHCHDNDSSNSSIDSKSDRHIRKHTDGYQRARADIVTGGRIRTESNSSVGSDTHRDWKEGCRGWGSKSRKSNENRNWRACEGGELNFSQGERNITSNNLSSWREASNGRQGFQRDHDRGQGFQREGSYGRGERRCNINQYSGSKSSSMHRSRGESDTIQASTPKASQVEGRQQKSENAVSQRTGFKVKE